jgi:hypothetical protein
LKEIGENSLAVVVWWIVFIFIIAVIHLLLVVASEIVVSSHVNRLFMELRENLRLINGEDSENIEDAKWCPEPV